MMRLPRLLFITAGWNFPKQMMGYSPGQEGPCSDIFDQAASAVSVVVLSCPSVRISILLGTPTKGEKDGAGLPHTAGPW